MMRLMRVLERLVLLVRASCRRAPCSSPPRCLPPWLECASSMMMAKRAAAMLVADLVEDERELLHRRDDDLLAALEELRRSPERSGDAPTVAPTWANCLMVSRICLSRMRRSVTTMIESKTALSSLRQADRADAPARRWSSTCRCRPSAGSGSARPAPCCPRVGQELPHHVELVVAREDLHALLPAGLGVLLLHDLGVVLEDVGQAPPA